MESKIKDISLHEQGRQEIQLAEVEMPGLMSCRQEYGPKQSLKGARIMGSLHMTIQTAVLIETLTELGADVRWCSCNIYSTQDQAAAAIAKAGKSAVFAWKGETLQEYWDLTMNAITWPDGYGPHQIVDDGGDATILLIEGLKWEKIYKETGKLPEPTSQMGADEIELFKLISKHLQNQPDKFTKLTKNLKGISEETTTGVHRLYELEKQGRILCPCINVNDSVTKTKFDNIYGCRHSLPDGLNRATDVMLAGKKVLVIGYGDVGKGCAASMRAANSIVYIAEVDPICALQACMEGYRVVKIDSVVHEIDVFITATGNKNIIMAKHMQQMKNNAIVCNIGHFDNEIDMLGLEKVPGIQKQIIKDMVARWQFSNGKGVIILAEGRLMNLGCATGHPSFVMSNSFTNQTLAQIELWENNGKYEKKVYKLSRELDEKVAKLHLAHLGAELTELSDEQADYINVNKNGPFKSDSYKY